jgi:hypothetical protein
MPNRIERSIQEPIREDLTWQEAWQGPDKGIIFCWEKGRRERLERPDDDARAQDDHVMNLPGLHQRSRLSAQLEGILLDHIGGQPHV